MDDLCLSRPFRSAECPLRFRPWSEDLDLERSLRLRRDGSGDREYSGERLAVLRYSSLLRGGERDLDRERPNLVLLPSRLSKSRCSYPLRDGMYVSVSLRSLNLSLRPPPPLGGDVSRRGGLPPTGISGDRRRRPLVAGDGERRGRGW